MILYIEKLERHAPVINFVCQSLDLSFCIIAVPFNYLSGLMWFFFHHVVVRLSS